MEQKMQPLYHPHQPKPLLRLLDDASFADHGHGYDTAQNDTDMVPADAPPTVDTTTLNATLDLAAQGHHNVGSDNPVAVVEEMDEDDDDDEGQWTLLDPYVNPGNKPQKSMKIGKLGKPVPVKTHSVLTIKLSNGRRAAMNLDIAEDSILPSSTERPALVWQTMGEYPEASSIENKFAQQVSKQRKECRKVVRQWNERASIERLEALHLLKATRDVVTEAERREEKPPPRIDEGGESSDSDDDNNNEVSHIDRRSVVSARSPGLSPAPHGGDPSRLSLGSIDANNVSTEYSAMLPVRRGGDTGTTAARAAADIAKEAQFRDLLRQQEEYASIIQKYLLKEFQAGNDTADGGGGGPNSPGEARTGVDLLNRDLERNAQNIYAKVRKWQDQVEPLLEEQDNRPPFTLESYTKDVIEKVKTSNEKIAEGHGMSRSQGHNNNENAQILAAEDDDDDSPLPSATLDDILQGEPAWNVGRLFLSALILTNNGNMDIFDKSGTSPDSPDAHEDDDAEQGAANSSQLSEEARGLEKRKKDRKKYGIRLLDADKCVNYDVEEPDDVDNAGGGHRSRTAAGPARGKRARRR
ncbi:hypothetical protein Pmar_PMAR018668 [Perkinsus marinus ATCC 50983]|uniref:Condensin-2 complex subunit H2 C-terminal domain-containing protein n=1 Tax=Perkinsus marinus (strain ATCC 50983 / TXsc) TaxID=423536 RepID=C5LYP7_PERM5|nr:hypothetical protein Pmar_PMAR018668 [Perkinsus marinus ATCC 50983]EEQ98141.1 hypothetical protein Pmar_PMAR018668 [Perkinsus marinus ATCC 50983]|eukprot:XP_002765424.1 hypothetical protein Pmar_PMAR018668 [Perkinsus marinus ATCC 50983]